MLVFLEQTPRFKKLKRRATLHSLSISAVQPTFLYFNTAYAAHWFFSEPRYGFGAII